jgi:hypothetical protein
LAAVGYEAAIAAYERLVGDEGLVGYEGLVADEGLVANGGLAANGGLVANEVLVAANVAAGDEKLVELVSADYATTAASEQAAIWGGHRPFGYEKENMGR